MTRRERSLLMRSLLGGVVALAGGMAVWFALTRDRTQPPPEPQQVQKTPAELLVGTWKLVKQTPPHNPPLDVKIEFAPNGEVTMWIHNPLDGPHAGVGRWRLDGASLRLTMSAEPDTPDSILTIDSLTEEKLIISGQVKGELHVYECARVREGGTAAGA